MSDPPVAIPASLPRPQVGGYRITTTADAATIARERTASRRVLRSAQPIHQAALSWILTDAAFADFAAWWRHDLHDGSTPFLMQMPNGYDDGEATMRFAGLYKATDLVGRWRITVTAEFLTYPILSAEDLEYYLTNGLPIDDIDALHVLVHQTFPARIYL